MNKVFLIVLVFVQSIVYSKDYNILDFGAISNTNTLNTKAIQSAINQANLDGGGRVIIPEGTFLSGSIVLKSGVDLHLMKKAVLLGSTNHEDYIKIRRWKALVMADSAQNIAISGKGTIDGQGAQLALNIDSLFYIGKLDRKRYNFVEKRPKYYMRPQVIEFMQCANISVTDVTIKNAACWVSTYDLCENLIINNIRIESDAYWNNDGIDLVDCKNVSVTNCYINSSDDGICLKSSYSKVREGVDFGLINNYCENIYIANCTVRSSASAIKFGTFSMGGFKNVTIENIKVFDTYRSAIAIECVYGGTLENVTIQNIKAVNTGNAIFIRLGNRLKTGSKVGIPGQLKNVLIKNVKVQVPLERPDYKYKVRGPDLAFFHNTFPSSITGIPGHPVENVRIEDVTIIYPGRGNKSLAYSPLSRLEDVPENEADYPEFSMFGELPAWGFYVRHVTGLSMKNIVVKIKKADYRPAFVFDDVKKLDLQSIKIVGDKKTNSIILNEVEKVKTVE